MSAFRLRLVFAECEHSGDLQRYAEDVHRSGAKILTSRMLDGCYETGEMVVEVADPHAFYGRFKQTESADFCRIGKAK